MVRRKKNNLCPIRKILFRQCHFNLQSYMSVLAVISSKCQYSFMEYQSSNDIKTFITGGLGQLPPPLPPGAGNIQALHTAGEKARAQEREREREDKQKEGSIENKILRNECQNLSILPHLKSSIFAPVQQYSYIMPSSPLLQVMDKFLAPPPPHSQKGVDGYQLQCRELKNSCNYHASQQITLQQIIPNGKKKKK